MLLQCVRPSELDFQSLLLPPNFGLVIPVCREIGTARIIDDVCPMSWNEHLTHGQVIEAMVLHILQAVDRLPLYRVQEWAQYHDSGLLYDCPCEAFNDDRIEVAAVHWDLTHVTLTGAYDEAGLSTEYYPKLTPREMFFRFGALKMLTVRARDGPRQCEIQLTVEQNYLLHELGFAQPGRYLQHLQPDHSVM